MVNETDTRDTTDRTSMMMNILCRTAVCLAGVDLGRNCQAGELAIWSAVIFSLIAIFFLRFADFRFPHIYDGGDESRYRDEFSGRDLAKILVILMVSVWVGYLFHTEIGYAHELFVSISVDILGGWNSFATPLR